MKPLSPTVIMYSRRIYKVYVMYVLALSDYKQFVINAILPTRFVTEPVFGMYN